jgi:hypothetical protein
MTWTSEELKNAVWPLHSPFQRCSLSFSNTYIMSPTSTKRNQ